MLAMLAATVLGGGMRLVWSEEFDYKGLPDPAKWTYETGFVRNKELQLYTARRKENARVEDGCLVIEARKDDYRLNPISSASVTTEGKAWWLYGRIEVRAKIPTGRGSWPAIWMMGINRPKVGWPKCGEIDVMENVGFDPDTIYGTAHWGQAPDGKHRGNGGKITAAKPYEDFHVYAVDWNPSRMVFLFDGKPHHTVPITPEAYVERPFQAPHYLILNLAFGGSWGAQRGVDESILPLRFLVDWVRVYQ